MGRAGLPSPNARPGDTVPGAYSPRVIDGDTAWFEVVEDGIPVTHAFRLIGVHTPETVHPQKGVEPFSPEASAFTKASLLDKWVYLEYDLEKTDDYDRHLAYVWLEDGTLFNLTLLEKGRGKFLLIAPNLKSSAHFIAAQKIVKQARAGMWASLPEISLGIDLASMSADELQP